MLVLARKIGDGVSCSLGGSTIRVRVLGVVGNRIKLGIDAPTDVTIHRDELSEPPLPSDMCITRRVPRTAGVRQHRGESHFSGDRR